MLKKKTVSSFVFNLFEKIHPNFALAASLPDLFLYSAIVNMLKVTDCYMLSLAMQFPWQQRDNFSFRKLRALTSKCLFSLFFLTARPKMLHLPAALKLTILRHLKALKGNPWAWKHAVCMCVPESAHNQLNHFHGELEADAEAWRLFHFIYCSKLLTPADNRSDVRKEPRDKTEHL